MAIDHLASHVSTDAGSYVAPVAEYEFLLSEAFGTDLVARSTDGELSAEDALDAIAAAGEFASEVFAPLNTVGDRVGVSVHRTLFYPASAEVGTREGADALSGTRR